MLAHRAAAVAMAVAAVRRGKRSLADLGLMSAKDLRTRKEGAIAAHQLAFKLHRVVRFLRRLETEQASVAPLQSQSASDIVFVSHPHCGCGFGHILTLEAILASFHPSPSPSPSAAFGLQPVCIRYPAPSPVPEG